MLRGRRLRSSAVLRDFVRENHLRVEELIYPIFVVEGENCVVPVPSMPGICQYSPDRLREEMDRVVAAGVRSVLLFGIPAHKDETGSAAFAVDGVVPEAIRLIKRDYPEVLVIADVCPCGRGHRGAERHDGRTRRGDPCGAG